MRRGATVADGAFRLAGYVTARWTGCHTCWIVWILRCLRRSDCGLLILVFCSSDEHIVDARISSSIPAATRCCASALRRHRRQPLRAGWRTRNIARTCPTCLCLTVSWTVLRASDDGRELLPAHPLTVTLPGLAAVLAYIHTTKNIMQQQCIRKRKQKWGCKEQKARDL